MASEPVSVAQLQDLVGEIRVLARQLLASESQGHSITPTALAMTALRRVKLKEQDWDNVKWENRAHFFSALALAMRHALVDYARRRKARGRSNIIYCAPDEILLGNLAVGAEEKPERLLMLEEALNLMEATDKRLSDVIQQFYFAGYSIPEMARFAEVSEKTIDRDLKRARTLLRKTVEGLAASA